MQKMPNLTTERRLNQILMAVLVKYSHPFPSHFYTIFMLACK